MNVRSIPNLIDFIFQAPNRSHAIICNNDDINYCYIIWKWGKNLITLLLSPKSDGIVFI